MNGLNDDLDLIIVGGYYGIGRRSGLISQFLLAVALDEQTHAAKDEDEMSFDLDETEKKISYPKTFLSFCRIGSGYSLEALRDFNQKITKKCKDFDKKNPPKHLQLTGEEKPDCWIEPKDSYIVQVKAVEICASDKYKAGVSLRFPRLVSFRQDKDWHECMRLSELNELKEKNNGKLASGKHLTLDDPNEDKENLISFGQPAFKKRKLNESSSSNSKIVRLHPRFTAIDTSGVKVSSGLFQNKEFYVVIDLDNEVYDRKAIETEIVKLGGRTTMSPVKETIIIATQKLHRLNGYIKNDSNDIVKIEWLTKCIQDNTLYEYKRSDMIHSKQETLKRLNQLYDCFGDSYTQPATVDSLREVFQGMEKCSYTKDRIRISLASFENKSFPNDSYKYGLFRIVDAYVDVMSSSLELIGLKIRWLGGLCSDQINENTTHVIFDKK
jgi:DNA ligase-4